MNDCSLRTHLYHLCIALTILSCTPEHKNAALVPAGTRKEAAYTSQWQGVPIPCSIKNIDLDSATQSLKKASTTFTQLSDTAAAGKIRVVPVPEDLTVITPGQNGVPLPDTFLVERNVMPAYFQPPEPALVPQKKELAISSISNLGKEQGLESSALLSVIEDQQGELWLGGFRGGVIRYDGHHFFKYAASEGFTDGIVWTMFIDRKGILWFGTYGNGLFSYDGQQFTQYSAAGKFTDSYIKGILEDGQGNLWLGTDGNGLICFNGHQFIQYTEKQGLCSDKVWSIALDRLNNIWVGTNGRGANRFDGNSFTHFSLQKGLSSNTVKSIFEDSQGNLWFGMFGESYGGLDLYTPAESGSSDNGSFTHYTLQEDLKHPSIFTIREDSRGNLWIGTDGDGIYCLEDDHIFALKVQDGIANNNVVGIEEDSWGNMWFSTWGGGIIKYNLNNAITHLPFYKFIEDLDVRCFLEDSNGNFWIGTFGSGLICLKRGHEGIQFIQYTTSEGLFSNNVISIEEGPKGELWLGSSYSGISRFSPSDLEHDQRTSLTHFSLKDGGNAPHGRWIEKDRQGRIWFGSVKQGLYYIDPADPNAIFRHFNFEENCLNDSYSMLQDSRGNLWFGTGCGLIRYRPDDLHMPFDYYPEPAGIAQGPVSGIFEDSQGTIWLATLGDGLYKYEQHKGFTQFTADEGLVSNHVISVNEDQQQRIWLSSEEGITVLVPMSEEEEGAAVSKKLDYKVLTLEKDDGIKSVGIEEKGIYIDRQNFFWVGFNGGVSKIDLNNLKFPDQAPKVKLNSIDVAQRTVDYRRLNDSTYRAELPYGNFLAATFDSVASYHNYPLSPAFSYRQNHLTFHFSAIDWAAPQKIRYRYLLEGLDKDWSPLTKESKADYRNLSPGHYTFRLKAIGAANMWSEIFEYSFHIDPPWWASWWAYLFYFLVLAGLLYFLYRFLLHRQLVLQEARQLRELDQFKTQLYVNITHEFRTPLTVITGMADQVLEHPEHWFREGLTMIKRNGLQLLGLVNQLLDLSRLESGRLPVHLIQDDIIRYFKYLTESFHSYAESRDIRLHLLTGVDELSMDFDPEKIQTIFSNLVGNAIKYTPTGGDVYITVDGGRSTKDDRGLELKIQDNGRGISAAALPHIFDRFYQADNSSSRPGEGTGIGLALTKELVHLLGGSIEVKSREGKGTQFTVYLPVRLKALKAQAIAAVPETPTAGSPPSIITDAVILPVPDTNGEFPLALLIEDNRDVQRYLAGCLQHQYRLEMADNGRTGIEKAIDLVPDIIISDIMMPGKDGFEVVDTLKRDDRTSHIPIILLTAKADLDSRLEGLERGADAYLAKPFEKKELEVRLRKMIEFRQKLSTRYNALTPAGAPNTPAEAKEDAFLQKLRQIVEINLGVEDFGVTQLCRELGGNRTQVHRKLKALTGKSTSQVIRTIRMQRAKELLMSRELNVSEVGNAIGYTNPSQFITEYTKEFGETPGNFKDEG